MSMSLQELSHWGRRINASRLAAVIMTSLCLPCVASAETPTRPVLVELYTSEGCSSCPPAEALMEEIAKRPDVLPLTFHVDYWDGLGWRDRFSMKEATQRQQDLARTLGLSTVGTPQIFVDGRTAVWGANRQQLENALKAPRRNAVSLQVTRKERELTVRMPARTSQDVYDVYVVGYLPRAVTHIARGENAGRTLTEINVVRYIRKIGESGTASREWTVPLGSVPDDASRIVVIVQSRTSSAIVDARTVS